MTFQPNQRDKYEIMTDNIRIIYLELNKYIVSDENIKYKLSKWVDFLKDPINLNKETIADNDINKAREILEYISTNDEERLIIEKIIEGRNDFYSAKNTAREEGKEEGLKEGKIEIAKNMLKDNVDINIISKYSGLTIAEIENLRK